MKKNAIALIYFIVMFSTSFAQSKMEEKFDSTKSIPKGFNPKNGTLVIILKKDHRGWDTKIEKAFANYSGKFEIFKSKKNDAIEVSKEVLEKYKGQKEYQFNLSVDELISKIGRLKGWGAYMGNVAEEVPMIGYRIYQPIVEGPNINDILEFVVTKLNEVK